jgi:hypothetical protein
MARKRGSRAGPVAAVGEKRKHDALKRSRGGKACKQPGQISAFSQPAVNHGPPKDGQGHGSHTINPDMRVLQNRKRLLAISQHAETIRRVCEAVKMESSRDPIVQNAQGKTEQER